jgi:hypothetical protein
MIILKEDEYIYIDNNGNKIKELKLSKQKMKKLKRLKGSEVNKQ